MSYLNGFKFWRLGHSVNTSLLAFLRTLPAKLKPCPRACVCANVQGQVGPFKQYVVYEKRRVYVQYVVFYKSDRPVPTLPEVPLRLLRTGRRSGSAGHCADNQSASDDESGTDTDSCDGDDDKCLGLRQQSTESLDNPCSSLENEFPELDGGVRKVSVMRDRTRALLQSGGQ